MILSFLFNGIGALIKMYKSESLLTRYCYLRGYLRDCQMAGKLLRDYVTGYIWNFTGKRIVLLLLWNSAARDCFLLLAYMGKEVPIREFLLRAFLAARKSISSCWHSTMWQAPDSLWKTQ